MFAVFENGRRRRFDVSRVLDRMSRAVATVDQAVPLAVSSALPLPGIGDAKSNIESIAAALQAIPYERSRCSALALKVRSLSSMIDDLKVLELELVDDIAEQIHEMKQDLDRVSASSCSSVRRADRVLESLKGIKERTDGIMAVIQTQLQLQKSARDDYQHMVVREHEIADQTVVPFERWTWTSGLKIQLLDANPHGNVTESRRVGRVGDISVVYTKYSGIRASDAEKMARARVDWHQRCLHPNVATVFGVTTGRRLNGVVLATGALSLEAFWSKVQSPRAVAQCITDLLTVPSIIMLESGGESDMGKRLYSEIIRVNMDGRISFTLTDKMANCKPLSVPDSYETKSQYTWILMVLDMCASTYYGDRYSAFSDFLGQLAPVSDGCTELKVLQLADSTSVPPDWDTFNWSQSTPPPFTICAGDVGVVRDSSALDSQGRWQSGSKWDVHSRSHSVEDASQEEVWSSQELPVNLWHNESINISEKNGDYRQWSSSERADFWKQRLRDKPVATVEDLSVCFEITYVLKIVERGNTTDTTCVYYHRRPFAVSHSGDFWGYLSFSADPEDRNSELERNGWVFDHYVFMDYCKLVDDWGYRYRRLLRKSMRELPGSFPTEEQDNGLDALFDDEN